MFKGSFVAIVSPMHQDFSIDYQSFEKLIEFHIENKTDGIVAMGTTGESPTLSHQEHKKVLQFCKQKIAGRVPLIAGAGSNNTAEAIDFANFAKSIKADASLQITPYYNRPNQAGLKHHFGMVAKQAKIAHILYNVPARTGCDLLPQTTIELANQYSNIVGIKEAADDSISRVKSFSDQIKTEFSILSGDDKTTYQFMHKGAHGVISVTANVAAKKMHDMCQYCLNNQFTKAEMINKDLIDLHEDLFCEPSPAPTKWALKQLNLCNEYVRSPLLSLTTKGQMRILAAMKKAQLI